VSTKKRHQTAAKRDRERAVELKRTLKRQKKQEAAAAAREGEGEGEEISDSGDIEPTLPDDSDGTPRETEAIPETGLDR
jgi:hypothetical protein